MKGKPDESRLISFLYGELEGDERKEVEEYLESQPEAREELEDFRHARKTLETFADREVVEPTIIISRDENGPLFSKPFLRALAVAASVTVLMFFSWLLGLNMTMTGQGLYIGFGGPSKTDESSGTERKELTEMVNSAVKEMGDKMEARFNGLENQIGLIRTESGENIDGAVKKAMYISQDQIRDYTQQLNSENKAAIQKLFDMNKEDQDLYLQAMLNDFTDYIEKRREADLEMIDLYFTEFKQDTEVKQLETNQVLASIIDQVSSTSKGELE